MKWWILAIVLPLGPAIIGFLVASVYVECLPAAYSAIGQGQLFFVTVGIASRCLVETLKRPGQETLTGLLFIIIIVSSVMYGAATTWKHQAPQKEKVASLLVIGGSLGTFGWVINIAFEVLSGS